MLPYTTAEEFTLRVANTVISFNGTPQWISTANPEDRTLSHYPLPLSNDEFRAAIRTAWNDRGWDAHNMKLGYINWQRGPGMELPYITRVPARHAHQGLTSRGIFIPPESGASWDRLLRTSAFNEMWAGSYPSFSEACKMVKEKYGPNMVAFARRWALSFDPLEVFYLHYRGKRIAVGHTPDSFKLPSNAKHLAEVAQEQGLRVA